MGGSLFCDGPTEKVGITAWAVSPEAVAAENLAKEILESWVSNGKPALVVEAEFQAWRQEHKKRANELANWFEWENSGLDGKIRHVPDAVFRRLLNRRLTRDIADAFPFLQKDSQRQMYAKKTIHP
jgi:hypothetical protein